MNVNYCPKNLTIILEFPVNGDNSIMALRGERQETWMEVEQKKKNKLNALGLRER